MNDYGVLMMIDIDSIMSEGMNCLLENLGPEKTAIAISEIKNGNFDYTEWRRDKFNDMSLEELNKAAAEYSAKLHSEDNVQ